jgi:hypothetical protein
VIALVPDPVDAHIGWLFDPLVESIQRAAEASHYTLDRFELPWSDATNSHPACSTNAAAGANAGGDGKGGSVPCGVRPPHHAMPGVMLFRSGSAGTNGTSAQQRRDGLVVFLVGETPTGGIHKAALTAALNRVAEARTDPIAILGPTFSGSTRSLTIALDNWWKANTQWQERRTASGPAPAGAFRVVSGSATGLDVGELLQVGASDQGPIVTFQATVLPDTFVLPQLFAYLHDTYDIRPAQVALLVEANTDYGNISKELLKKLGTDKPNPLDGDVLVLPFPMHIAGTRSALERVQTKAPAADSSRFHSVGPDLELALDDGHDPLDLPPQMFPRITGPSDEFVITNILATISRNGIQFVGLLASDALDKIFLARQVRKYCPGVRLFTIESDLQYAHPSNRQVFNGMLVASTYSLFNRAQEWTALRFAPRLQFSSSIAEGMYNAALVLIGGDAQRKMTDYALPQRSATGTDYTQEPVLWISAVGNGGIWPLKAVSALTDDAAKSYIWTKTMTVRPDDTSEPRLGSTRTAIIFWVLLTLFSLAIVVSYFVSTYRPMTADPQTRWGRFANRVTLPLLQPLSHRGEQLAFLLICFATVAALYWYVGQFFGQLHIDASGVRIPVGDIVVTACALALSVTLIVICGALARRIRQVYLPAEAVSEARRRLERAFGIAIVTLMIATPVVAIYSVAGASALPDLLAAARGTAFDSLLSPLVPCTLVAAAWFVWGRCHLRRLMLLEVPVGRLVLDGDDRHGVALSTANAQITSLLRQPFWAPLALAAWLWTIPCLFLAGLSLPTLEGATFDRLFRVAFFAASLWVVITFAQLQSLWWKIRRLLERLDVHPIARQLFGKESAYKRLPAAVKERVKNSLYAYRPSIGDLEHTIDIGRELLTRLSSVHQAMIEELAISAGDLEEFIKQFSEQQKEAEAALLVAVQDLDGIPPRRDLQERIDDMAELLVKHLLSKAWKAAAVKSSDLAAWLVSAENFVAAQCVAYVGGAFVHVRNLIASATGGLLLLLLTVPSYPFQPEGLLNLFIWVMVLAAVGAVLVAILQMNRCSVLSEITGGTANEISFDRTLFSPLLKYGAVPLLSLFATQFPGIGETIFSWITPFLGSVK